ncbi:hypothetical protein ACHAWC_005751 [Mediolabrus comicus]
MDGATTASTGSNSGAAGSTGSNTNGSSSGLFNFGGVGGMGLFSGGGGGGGAGGSTSLGGGGDALAGFSSLGNGFSSDASGSGTIGGGATGGGSGNPSFDLNDFPSLGGGGGGNASAAPGGNEGLAAALRQQQLLQQQMLSGANSSNDKSSNLYRLAMGGLTNGSSAFKVENEDFPALGAPNSNSGGGAPGSGLTVGGGDGASEGVGGLGGVVGGGSTSLMDGGLGGAGSVGGNNLDYTGLVGGGNQSTQTRTNATSTQQPGSSSGSTGTVGSAIGGDFGLLGLLSVIRMTDADRNRLALGSDLTVLGLNLNSNDNLYSTFGGPFSDKPATREPHYQLPMCYYMQPPALKTGHLSKFQLETLFYIFYALPKDVLQAYAAQELYTRDWRYHVESKVWFKQATPSDVPNGNVAAGQYIYFDINTWERRLYGNVNQNIAGGFLPEDDVRVKFPSS